MPSSPSAARLFARTILHDYLGDPKRRPGPQPAIGDASYTVAEGAGRATIRVVLGAATGATATVTMLL